MKWDNFTVARIANFICADGKQQSIYMDGKTPGLGLRVTQAGAKSYIFESRLHGKTLRLTIGDIRTWSLVKAQSEATRLKALTDQGVDPRLEAEQKRSTAEAAAVQVARQCTTLRDAWKIYVDERKANWSAGHILNHSKLSAPGGKSKKKGEGETKAGPLAALMHLTLPEIKSEKVSAWLKAEAAERPTNAHQSYRLLRAFLRWASEKDQYKDLISTDAYSARSVRDVVPKSKSKEGDCLQREQLPAWFQAVLTIQNPVVSAYFQALLLTGARRRELSSLQWGDLDFQWGKMTIKDKVEGSREIPLTPYVAKLLENLPRRNDWVFSSVTAADGKLTEPTVAHKTALESANLPHVTLHGLRRSFGTLCEWIEMPVGISAQIMGHKPSALAEKHYRRRSIDMLRKWHERIESWVLNEAGIIVKATDVDSPNATDQPILDEKL